MTSNQDTPEDIDAYIARFPPEVQEILQQVRLTIRAAAPAAKEKISYQMPTFTLEGNLVHFAAHKQHIGFYPTPSAIATFKDALATYRSSKGAVQFPLDKPIPYDLIADMVRFRVREQSARATSRAKRR